MTLRARGWLLMIAGAVMVATWGWVWWAAPERDGVITTRVPYYGPCDPWEPGPALVSTKPCMVEPDVLMVPALRAPENLPAGQATSAQGQCYINGVLQDPADCWAVPDTGAWITGPLVPLDIGPDVVRKLHCAGVDEILERLKNIERRLMDLADPSTHERSP